MAKIPFQLETWLKDKSQKLETGVGEPVRILCTNAAGLLSIIGNVGENSENLQRWTEKGQYHVGINTPDKDLFIIAPEKELTNWEKTVGLDEARELQFQGQESPVDWSSFRREVAKDVLPTLIYFANNGFEEESVNLNYWTCRAVEWADALIEKLK